MEQLIKATAYTNFVVNRFLAYAYYGPQIIYCLIRMGWAAIMAQFWLGLAKLVKWIYRL